jgi:hypothetical protein
VLELFPQTALASSNVEGSATVGPGAIRIVTRHIRDQQSNHLGVVIGLDADLISYSRKRSKSRSGVRRRVDQMSYRCGPTEGEGWVLRQIGGSPHAKQLHMHRSIEHGLTLPAPRHSTAEMKKAAREQISRPLSSVTGSLIKKIQV